MHKDKNVYKPYICFMHKISRYTFQIQYVYIYSIDLHLYYSPVNVVYDRIQVLPFNLNNCIPNLDFLPKLESDESVKKPWRIWWMFLKAAYEGIGIRYRYLLISILDWLDFRKKTCCCFGYL